MNPKWFLKKTKFTKDKGKVFSTFGSGGGSTLGYKLAGYDVIAYNEVEQKIADVYLANHNPKYAFIQDIRELADTKTKLPDELYDLDILDGSPPCASFSMAGIREKGWGKERTLHEGKHKQTLDDLFFVFIDLVKKLKPKIVVAENVKGMLAGNARPYIAEVKRRMEAIGYDIQLFLVNSSDFGAPQRRERVIFIARRKDLNLPKFELNNPKYKPITYGEIKTDEGILDTISKTYDTKVMELWKARKRSDKTFMSISQRLYNKPSFFNYNLITEDMVAPTLTASANFYKYDKPYKVSSADMITIQTFPQDYDFVKNKWGWIVHILGRSVPPFIYKHIGGEIYKQWLSKL